MSVKPIYLVKYSFEPMYYMKIKIRFYEIQKLKTGNPSE